MLDPEGLPICCCCTHRNGIHMDDDGHWCCQQCYDGYEVDALTAIPAQTIPELLDQGSGCLPSIDDLDLVHKIYNMEWNGERPLILLDSWDKMQLLTANINLS